MADQLTQAYEELLDGTYDCVDRIVLNAYYRSGHIAGGFREWWRRLYGSDEDLDDAHLMRMAGRFSRRLRSYCEKQGIPVIDCRQGERKHEIARPYLPQKPEFDRTLSGLGGTGISIDLACRADQRRTHSQPGAQVRVRQSLLLPYHGSRVGPRDHSHGWTSTVWRPSHSQWA